MVTLADALVDENTPPALRPFAHALTADRVWLLRLREEGTEGAVLWPDLDATACRALAHRNADAYASYLDGLDEDRLDDLVTYRTSRGVAHENTVADVLDHVLIHASHHRGQVNAALRTVGPEPPHIDFMAWLRAGEPVV